MQALTLTIAAIASLLIAFLPPAQAFAVYVITLLFYPIYLVLQVGSLDISAARIAVTVLLLRCMLSPQLRQRFKWCPLDSWVTFGAIVSMVIPLISWRVPFTKTFENTAGHLMDTFLAYLVTRYCLTDHKAIVTAVKLIGIALAPLALLGVIESYTGWQSYNTLKVYCPWLQVAEPQLAERTGFYRAVGPFNHPILFGAAFAMFLPLVYWLRHEGGYWRRLNYLLVGLIAIGVLSSMSSGPWMMLIMTVALLVLEHFKQWVKPLLIFLVSSCIVVSTISNRPFYHVLASYADPIGGSGWHRAALIDLAIEHFGEWWLAGYGGSDPGWGSSLGMTRTDITNHYIVAGVKYGLLGLIALLGSLVMAILMLVRLHNSTKDSALRSWYWAMGIAIVILAISLNACCLFGQAGTLFYCILGFVGSSFNMSLRTVLDRFI